MATLNHVKPEHRTAAGLIPKKVLASLHPEEARYRTAKLHAITEVMPSSGEAKRAMQAHRSALARALPVTEYLARIKRLKELEASASPKRDENGESAKDGFIKAIVDLKRANIYPNGFPDAVERRITGQTSNAEFDGCDLDCLLGRAPVDDSAKRASSDSAETISLLTKTVGASLDSQIDELKASIVKLKQKQNADAVALGLLPPHKAVAADTAGPGLAGLRKNLERFAQLSKDTLLEPELRHFYEQQFTKTEREYARAKRAAGLEG